MSVKNLIVVVGATGNQGGSVVDTFVSEPNWRVRALTRNTSSTKAKALANRGVEVIYADMDDPSTLALAFNGANATFVVSDFWGFYGDPANKDKPTPGQPLNIWAAEHETEQLKNVIDAAAKLSTLEPFVFSSLSNASKCSNGRYTHVYHFDSKAQAEDYGREKYPDLWSKTSILQAGFFLSNFVTNPSMQPFKDEDGAIRFITSPDPEKKFPFIAAERDTGPITKALVQESPGKNVIAYREWLTLRESATILRRVTGLAAEVFQLPRGQLRSEVSPDLKLELDDNWAYLNGFPYEGTDRTVIHPNDLVSLSKLDTVANYIKEQHWAKILDSA